MSNDSDVVIESDLRTASDKILDAVAIEQEDGSVTHHVTFTDETILCCKQELDDIRSRGYELQAFGNNLQDCDNLTATFVETGVDE